MKRPFVIQAGSGVLLAVAISQILHAATPLPVPCAPGACGNNANAFVTKGAATAVQSGNSLTVSQASNNAVLNWSSFNIGVNGKVTFAQPNAGSIALNRIFDANPSSILGSLNANGQIYLINANGFLFGSTARVNTAGLIASSLNISDSTFASGILAPVLSDGAALQPFTDANGNAVVNTGSVTVQQGAQLTATNGGRLLLAAPTVQNAGTLTANDGQVVLAAGQTVYLQASSDPSLRGLIVQVDGGGSVANQLTGALNAARGNITLTGLMVNQDGRISATTTVSANGSVRLEAGDGVVFNGLNPIGASQGGTLELGRGSSISILPEYSDTATAVDAQTQLQSSVSLVGQQVLIHGASIVAPSGSLSVSADADPFNGVQTGSNSNARIRIDAGTHIDLSGSDAELPMSANLVTVQLRSNELADDPAQRNGALRGQTVTVDARADGGAGTPIANVSSAIAAVGKNIAQRTEAGGTASFQSEGDIVFNPGASINVSGGHTTYDGGTIQTTALIGANGSLVDIGSASPSQTYSGVVNPTFTQTYDKWGVKDVVPTPLLSHYEASYQQGAAAGTVQFAAPALVLQGSLNASVVNGPHQRGAVGTFGGAVPGGTLIIGLPQGAQGNNQPLLPDFLAPGITITNLPTPVAVADSAALPPQSLQLPASMLMDEGFTNTRLFSNTTISLPAGVPLNLPGGSSLTLSAARVEVDSNLIDLGGALKFASILTIADHDPLAPTLGPGQPRTGVVVGSDVTLDVSGRWSNDSVASGGIKFGQTLQNAGSVTLQSATPGSELEIGDAVAIKADGGAWLQANGTLAYGKGGAITLDSSPSQSAVQFGKDFSIEAFGVETASGGRFSLTAPRIDIAQGTDGDWTQAQLTDDATANAPALHLFAPLFSDFGFSTVSLTATGAAQSPQGDVLTLLANTHVTPLTQSRLLNSDYVAIPDGGTIGALSHVGTLPLYLRPSTSVAFNVERLADDTLLGNTAYGTLEVQSGASIAGDPGSKVALVGEGNIVVSGALRAPGGAISLQILSPPNFDNTTSDKLDPGYDPLLGISLGSNALLDVSSGGVIYAPNGQNLLLGNVLTGGTVSIVAQRGFVNAAQGSSIDIAGGSGLLDVATPGRSVAYTRETVASAGGSLTVSSVESISFLSTLNAKAGSGNSGTAAGGSLELDLARSEVIQGQPDPYGLPMELNLVDGLGSGLTPRVNYGAIGVSQIENSGADSLVLRAGGTVADGSIVIDTAQPLALGRQLVLDARSVSVGGGLSAQLAAPLIEIGNSQTQGEPSQAPTPTGGTGSLSVNAGQLVLFGNFALQGVANTTLASQGDIQLQGVTTQTGPEVGSLVTAGNLTLNAARLYPDTYTDFTLQTVGSGALGLGSLTIGQSSASPGAPLSAGGTVSVLADDITVNGTLLAPFGQLSLTAGDKLILGEHSLVSVSGAGITVPFGQTQDGGREWIYQTNGVNPIGQVPQKAVSLTAPNMVVKPSATVDLQGGGGLYAYEWVPGTGGSKDQLSQALANASGYYAILPSQKGLAAPFDPQESSVSGIGKTVYLSGGAGIAPRFYALLPARYALEPGALLIQVQPSYVSANGGQIGALGNGAPVIAGYFSVGTTGLHTGTTEYEGFAVYPGSYGEQLANYQLSDASTFFGAAAAKSGTTPVPLTADAGSLVFNVVQSLNNSFTLQGSVLTGAATGGAGALVNVSAPSLEVTGSNASGQQGNIAISGSVLQGWNASELVLGGSLTPGSGNVAVSAGNVTIDSGVSLTADQIVLVAQQAIDVKSGAILSSTSGKSGTALATPPALQQLTLTNAGAPTSTAALLAVSDLALPVAMRSGVATGGSINLESGSQIKSLGAIALDAPAITADGAISGKGASWSLSSNSIAFVGGSSSGDSLSIGTTLLGSLQQASAVRIESQSSVDIATPLTLGTTAGGAKALGALTILADAINNQSGGDVTLGATTLTLGGVNSNGSAASGGTGTLSLVANNLELAPNSLSTDGFAHVVAQVPGSIGMKGNGALNVGGDLALNAAQIAPTPGATYAVTSAGAITIGAPITPASGSVLTSPVGGALSLTGTSIIDNGKIVARSGLVTLNATNGDVSLGSNASIDTSGAVLSVGNQTVATPGGSVGLQASGAVTLAAGSVVNVAGAQSAPAGTLSVAGGGTVTLGGSLNGAAGTLGTGGSFLLDAGQLDGGLTPLAAILTQSGFSQGIDVRVRSGTLDLAQGATLSANQVALTADAGDLTIEGTINAASAGQRGHIELSSGTGVDLGATGQLHADAAGAQGQGGEIEINSSCATCTITLAGGSLVSAQGAGGNGQLILRAPALTSSNDVAINLGSQGLGADVSKVGQVILEPVITVNTTGATVDSDLANGVSTASAFLTNASSGITARLAPSNPSVSVQAGLELVDANAQDALTIHSFDLSSYSAPIDYGFSQAPQVINLSVRAAGSINISGAISDGYIPDYNTGQTALSYLQTGPASYGPAPSGSLRFVAGADLSSANPNAILRGAAADLTLLTSTQPADGTPDGIGPSVIRTGTGDLNLNAARDVVFQAGTAAYTGGTTPADVIQPLDIPTLRGDVLINFGTQGGSVRINAGRDVLGSPPIDGTDNGNSAASAWLVRQGDLNHVAQYGINFGRFDWNVGALEGGDVAVNAGRNIMNLSAAAADSLVAGGDTYDGATLSLGAGGGLSLRAGGDVGSAQIYVADGTGTINAGGGLSAIRTTATNGLPVGSAIALGNSNIAVYARTDVQVDAIYNPTFVPQSENSPIFLAGQYLTYGELSRVSLVSSAGAVTLEINPSNGTLGTLVGQQTVADSGGTNGFQVLPGNLSVLAPQGDLNLKMAGAGLGSPTLFPTASGELTLVAGNDINATGGFTLADNPLGSYPTIAQPGMGLQGTGNATGGFAQFQGNIHAGDATPVIVSAGEDINNFYLSTPKLAQVVSGRDIINLSYFGQNNAGSDTTLIFAGRDLTNLPGSGNGAGIQLGGPGSLDVVAGRNLDLGFSNGFTTVGNIANANLPTAQGADINVMVGYGSQGADIGGFLQKVVAKNPTDQTDLVNYVEATNGDSNLSFAQAETEFQGFTPHQQSALIDQFFFNELLLSGRAANSGTGVGFAQGYAAIDALYPGSRGSQSPYAGDLTLTSSQIYTLSGGSISLLVPGGLIDVGLANPPPTIAAKSPSLLGIVAQGSGNVSIYSKGDVNVNQSRVFTLGGGNILIWSNEGSIDAGNGSKSSLSVPPPVVLINANGTISLDFAGSLAAGSGIRTIQTSSSVPPGNVDLDAPVGTVNAGDAGIGASGNINIAAAHVIGIDNISFGGTAAGVPSDVSNLAASLSGASSVANSATSQGESSVNTQSEAAKELAPLAQNALSWLDVFVTGLGEENCKPADVECLKRQTKAAQ